MSAIRKEAFEYDYGQESLLQSHNSAKEKRIKVKKKNRMFLESLKNISMLAATFILGILLVYNYAVITDKKMELNNINEEIAEIRNDIDQYNVALESIQNSNNVEAMAKNYLGMSYPTRKQTVFIDFAYGDTETTNDETELASKDSNLLYGLIDKVKGFMQ
jgi:cell division protein FtsL